PLRLAFTSAHGASVWSAPSWRLGFQPSRGSSNQRYFFCWLRLSSWRPLHHFSGVANDRLNIRRQHEGETAAPRDVDPAYERYGSSDGLIMSFTRLYSGLRCSRRSSPSLPCCAKFCCHSSPAWCSPICSTPSP